MMGVSLIAGFLATTAAVVVGFYAAVATYRFGLDPDNHGDSPRHVEPRPPGRAVAYPGDRDPRARLMSRSSEPLMDERPWKNDHEI